MKLLDDLKTVAEAYRQARGISIGRVSRLAFGDGTKLTHILDGGADITTSRFERTMQWFSDNWPDGGEWPAGIERPARSECDA